jgi:hypothetical protein
MEGAAETRGEQLPGRVSGEPWAGGHRAALVDILKWDWPEQSKADWRNGLTKARIRIPCAWLCRRLRLIASNGSLTGHVTVL